MKERRPFPIALKHGDVQKLFEDIYFVTGTVIMKAPVALRFSRNMAILRQGDELTLVNSVRLNEMGLKQLDQLGRVKHVIRLAGFHGMDDPFYKDRYGAKIWSVDAPYATGVDKRPKPEQIYFEADEVVSDSTELPIEDAQLVDFKLCTPGEALMLLPREGGILISGDSLQNWAKADEYFNFTARVMMKMMGFLKPHNIGPGWLKTAQPDLNEIKALLDLDFDHLLPAHGEPVINGAKAAYSVTINRL